MQLIAVAEAHEVRRAEERATLEKPQGQLQQSGIQLQSEAELHRRQQKALSAQVEAKRRELAHFEERLRQEREDLAEVANEKDLQLQRRAAISEQVKAAKDAHSAREAALTEEARRVSAVLRAREERINDQARCVGEQQANAGRAWQQVHFNAAEVENRECGGVAVAFFYEAIPALHWCPDDRISEGELRFRVL
uniref:Uncharacterized protein n=1 Tax=Peronospora matthiolae TaxID=2874970 RepID=A0AAV1SYS5_9STRA